MKNALRFLCDLVALRETIKKIIKITKFLGVLKLRDHNHHRLITVAKSVPNNAEDAK